MLARTCARRAIQGFTGPVSGLTSGLVVLAVAPSREHLLRRLLVRSGSDSIVSNQGLRFNSITVAGAAPEWA